MTFDRRSRPILELDHARRAPGLEAPQAEAGHSRGGGGRRQAIAAAALILLITGVIFRKHLFAGYTFPWDFVAGFSHLPVFVTSTVGSGRFTEWIPFIAGGMPIAVNAQSGLYSPLWWLLGVLHIPATVSVLTVVQVLHVAFGALGVYALARSRRIGWPWALVAAVPYVFFGGFYGNAEHADIVRGHAYAPWVLWALTLPRDGRPWRKPLVLPLLLWVAATGAYPGQIVALLIVGSVYAATELWGRRGTGLAVRYAARLVPAAIAGLAIAAAAYLPYVAFDRAGLLFRPAPPVPEIRAIGAIHPVDLYGLYLDPFAWRTDATIWTWSIGVVVLIGLSLLRRGDLKEHAPIVLAGLAAAALAALPAWLPAGRLMARVPLLFPSRFPAADYKAVIAVTLVVLAAAGWRRGPAGRLGRWLPPLAALALVAGVFSAPQTTAIPPAKAPWFAVALIGAAAAAAIRPFGLRGGGLALAVLLLAAADGGRSVAEMEHEIRVRPWIVPGEAFLDRDRHDRAARDLRDLLAEPPERRPARLPPAGPLSEYPGGYVDDAAGFLGLDYRLGDYGGTIMQVRWRAVNDPELLEVMVLPWTAWAWPCGGEVACDVDEVPLPPRPWPETPAVHTASYGLRTIDYEVDLDRRSLVLENEFAVAGWSADRGGIRRVTVGGVLRGWVLPPGRYRFTASYVLPQRPAQLALGMLALLAWGVAALATLTGLTAPGRQTGSTDRPRRAAGRRP